MPDKYDYIAWIDLECADTNEYLNPILEIGLIVTDKKLNELEREYWIINPDEDFPGWIDKMSDFVRDMHTKNGLLVDVEAHGVELAEADMEISQLLDNYTTDGRMPIGGSGVGHFDMRFIREQLPQTMKRLKFWSMDIGVVRRYLRDIVGVEVGKPSEDKPHRALDDIALHVEEARRYVELLRPTDDRRH